MGSGALADSRRRRWSSLSLTVRAPRLSSNWSRVRAPEIGETIAGDCSTQARATYEHETPISPATSRTASTIVNDFSVRLPLIAMIALRALDASARFGSCAVMSPRSPADYFVGRSREIPIMQIEQIDPLRVELPQAGFNGP
jgi:hypothetical protein